MKLKPLVRLASATATAAAASFGAGYLIFYEVMNRNARIYPKIASIAAKKLADTSIPATDPRIIWFENQPIQEFERINSQNLRLKGHLIAAEKPSKVYVFCSHGYRSSGFGEYKVMTKFYHDLGYNFFIVDHQSHGGSDGNWIGFGEREYKDCLLWLDWMKEKFGDDIQIILQGISMGSATVMLMSGDDSLPDNVKFTVADCGFTTCKAQFEHCLKSLMHIPKFPILYTADIFNKKINGYDFADPDPINAVSKAKVPILFIHGNSDTFVPTYMCHQLYAACTSEYKDMLLVKGAAHAESYKRDSAAYEAKVKEFADKFIK